MFDQLLLFNKKQFAVQCLDPKCLIVGIIVSYSWVYICPHLPKS